MRCCLKHVCSMEGSELNAPRRIEAILTSVIEADDISRWVKKSGFTPEPRLIFWHLGEQYSSRAEVFDFLIKGGALEVDYRHAWFERCADRVHRKRGITLRGLEAGVVRRVDNELEAQLLIERH